MKPKQKLSLVLALLGGLFLFGPEASAATEVSGIIDTPTVWSKEQSPIMVRGNLEIRAGGEVVIEPGVVVKLDRLANIFSLGGRLRAVGTQAEPIIFTALSDAPFPSFWNSIFLGGSEDETSNAEISYGQFCVSSANAAAKILQNKIEQCRFGIDAGLNFSGEIAGNELRHNQIGVSVAFTSQAEAHNNLIADNTIAGIDVFARGSGYAAAMRENEIRDNPIGISVFNFPDAVIEQNNIFANSDYGAFNNTPAVPVSARNNWWGDASGPFHPALNPAGLGNAVSDGINFTPWLTELVEIEFGPPAPTRNPVIIIPGIGGTELYNGDDLIWPDLTQMLRDTNDQFITDNLTLTKLVATPFGISPQVKLLNGL